MSSHYKRVLIKISGESLGGKESIFSNERLTNVARQIYEISCKDTKVEVGVVVGAGNIWRGKEAKQIGMDRAQADYMGMIGTIMNAMALQNKIEQFGKSAIVYSAIECPKVAEDYIRRNVLNNLAKGRILIFAGGTGYPYFTTDTAAALRATEISADVILMAKNGVDGVYDRDPNISKNAKRFEFLTHDEVIQKNLNVMDHTAITLCKENGVDIIVFDMNKEDNIIKAYEKKALSTLISSKK